METSTFDPCLLVTRNKDGPFGMVAMQTDDTLILGDDAFVELEYIKLEKAKLMVKPIESLARDTLLIFNGYKLVIDGSSPNITLLQKGQGKRLTLIDPKSSEFKQAYLE